MFKIMTLLMSCLLVACMVGPDYKEPTKPIAEKWLINNPTIKNAPVQNANWWQLFDDPTLTCLIRLGYEHNLSIQSAGTRVLQARAQLAQSVGELYPQQQSLIGNLSYQRIGGTSLQSVLPSSFVTMMLGISANWEIDFWGKYRRAILSNDATFLASFAAYNQALVTLTSDIATAYINIRMNQELIKVTNQNIQIQTMGVKIAKSRFRAGETSLLDVEQAETELYKTQSLLPQYRSDLQHQKDLLAVLLGTTPDHIEPLLIKTHGIPRAPASVAVGIPRETLVKRPDIYQARLQAIAQSEAIGAAAAYLYPSFSLAGTFAFASNTIGGNSLGNLFNWNNRTITAGPGLNWSILNYGQITNTVRAQDAVFQQYLTDYLNLVLKAQQEVQDNITQFIETKNAEKYLNTANTSAIKSTKLAIIRYREGESDYTPVLDSERQQLQVETSLTKAQGDVPKALVALYRSLGGGWQIGCQRDILPDHVLSEMSKRTNWGNLLDVQNHLPPVTKGQKLEQLYIPNW